MSDKLPTVLPHCTVEFISGMCHALSNDRGEVIAVIRSRHGAPIAELRREEVDESVPSFLRKQAL